MRDDAAISGTEGPRMADSQLRLRAAGPSRQGRVIRLWRIQGVGGAAGRPAP
jgi:hypothetical protein